MSPAKAQENARHQVSDCFGLSSDWLRKWREIFQPITKFNNIKSNHIQLSFENRS